MEWPSTFPVEDRPLVVVVAAAGMDRATVRVRTRRAGSLESGRDLGDDRAGWYRTDCVRTPLDIGYHIGCTVTGEADHMDSLRRVGLHKGCIRRCNGRVVPRPPWCRLFNEFWTLDWSLTYL